MRDERKKTIAKAREAKRLKLAQREIVRKKVENGQPITEEERNLLGWKAGYKNPEHEKQVIAAAAKLMIRPQSVSELRLLVETTAAKHHYNPIESLIEQTRSADLDEKEKIGIHKALLPFLVPQLAAPKAETSKGEGGVKVTVTQFVFPDHSPKVQIHEEKPATVETTTDDRNPASGQ